MNVVLSALAMKRGPIPILVGQLVRSGLNAQHQVTPGAVLLIDGRAILQLVTLKVKIIYKPMKEVKLYKT